MELEIEVVGGTIKGAEVAGAIQVMDMEFSFDLLGETIKFDDLKDHVQEKILGLAELKLQLKHKEMYG